MNFFRDLWAYLWHRQRGALNGCVLAYALYLIYLKDSNDELVGLFSNIVTITLLGFIYAFGMQQVGRGRKTPQSGMYAFLSTVEKNKDALWLIISVMTLIAFLKTTSLF